MKLFLILCAITYCSAAATGSVGEFIDNVDPNAILENKALLTKVVNCIMDREPCAEFQPMRDNIPKLLKSKCNDCTVTQKNKYTAAIEKFKTQHYDMYKDMMEKYAPELLN